MTRILPLICAVFLALAPAVRADDEVSVNAMNPIQIRVMTFNIFHGETMKGDFDLDHIAGVIRAERPDVVALQEVDVKTGRAHGLDLAAELGRRTEMEAAFGKAMDFDGGAYGVAILARHGLANPRCVALPNPGENEPRAVLMADVTLPGGGTLRFASTHLEVASEADRLEQAEALNALLRDVEGPAILAGDFNALPDSAPLAVLQNEWKVACGDNPAPTFPSSAPKIKIDYVLVRPAARWEVVETRVIQDAVASDHCAYLAVLTLRPE